MTPQLAGRSRRRPGATPTRRRFTRARAAARRLAATPTAANARSRARRSPTAARQRMRSTSCPQRRRCLTRRRGRCAWTCSSVRTVRPRTPRRQGLPQPRQRVRRARRRRSPRARRVSWRAGARHPRAPAACGSSRCMRTARHASRARCPRAARARCRWWFARPTASCGCTRPPHGSSRAGGRQRAASAC